MFKEKEKGGGIRGCGKATSREVQSDLYGSD